MMTCLRSGAGGEDVGDALAEVGGGDEDGCAAVLEAVADGVGAEGGEEGAGDAAGLEGAEDGDVGLGETVHEDEDAVALGCAEAAEDVGELVGLEAHLVEGVALLLHVLAHPEHGEAVAAALDGVPVDALPADVEAAAGEPADLPIDSGPVERGPLAVVVVDIRREPPVFGPFGDDGFVHCRDPCLVQVAWWGAL